MGKFIITEEDRKSIRGLYEQTAYEMHLDRIMGDPVKAQAHLDQFKNMDPHTANTILQIATAFIPYVGPFISAGIGLYDAKMYYDEGDTKTAGLVGLFSVIPGIGGLSAKLGLTKWSAKALGELGKKISLGLKLTSTEIQVANIVAKNKNLILADIKASPVIAKEVAKQTTKEVLKQTAKQTGKTVTGYAATGTAYSKAYDTVQKDTPRAKAESEGLDWNLVKTAFGSSGTEQENKLLNQAWSKGWRPGQVVPQGFQTETYKTYYEEDINNIKQLQALIAQAS
jgi:hypothetical protein